MSERDYYNRMRKDLEALKKQVLSFSAQKRKECGYVPISIPKPMSNTGRPISLEMFGERFCEVVATSLWLQSILDKLNGLKISAAIEIDNNLPFPHSANFKNKRGRKSLGEKTQEHLLQKGFYNANEHASIGMRSWIKSSKNVSADITDVAKQLLDAGEPLLFMHCDEGGKVTYEADPINQRTFLDSNQVMANHSSDNLLRALAKGKKMPNKKSNKKK